MKNLLFTLICILIVVQLTAQDYLNATINNVAKRTVKNCFNKVDNSPDVYQVLIMPTTDDKGNITDKSNYISSYLATQLNNKLANSKQQFNVISFSELNNKTKDSLIAISQISEYKQSKDTKKTIEYFTKLMEVNNKHFFVTANYKINNDIYDIQNVRLEYNYRIMAVPEGKSFSITNKTTRSIINQKAVTMSLIPGMGQFYKQHKTKGILFVASVPILIGSGLYFNMMQQKYLTRWTDTGNQTSYNDYKTMKTMKNFMFVIGGTIYIGNLFDAYFTF